MYDHAKKAGNQGDVVKHVALVATLDRLLISGRDQFVYCDTFAGYPFSPLIGSGEWRNGIGRFAGRKGTVPNDDVRLWERFWSTGIPLNTSTYPGSSNFALRLAILRNRVISMHLWEISPPVVYQLMTVYQGIAVAVHPTPAAPEDIPASDFLLVDPPGVGPRNHNPTVEALLALCATQTAFLLWLPMLADLRTERPPPESPASRGWRQAAANEAHSTTTVRWTRGGPVCGRQLVYRLPLGAQLALREAVNAVVDFMGWDAPQHADP